jgi:heterodisulfide reductase subunit C2
VSNVKTHASTLAGDVHAATGVNVAECYQCGKCTAGCPMAKYMDLVPSQVMRLVQIGDAAALERLLSCRAIWSCAGCLTCTQRCPKKLDPAAVMDALRERSNREGKVNPSQKRILAFHKAFLKCVEKTGRMSEMPLTGIYKMTSGDMFSDVTLAPAMMARGKLPLVPKLIRGRKDVSRIFAACRRKGAQR